jgi:hypothetical protein
MCDNFLSYRSTFFSKLVRLMSFLTPFTSAHSFKVATIPSNSLDFDETKTKFKKGVKDTSEKIPIHRAVHMGDGFPSNHAFDKCYQHRQEYSQHLLVFLSPPSTPCCTALPPNIPSHQLRRCPSRSDRILTFLISRALRMMPAAWEI